jgi:thioredoxin-like negative regulator of GroEL
MFDFDNKVLNRSFQLPVLVEFSSPSCGPCLWMEKTWVDITKKRSGQFEFVSLSVQDCIPCIDRYRITSNPTSILFVDGEEVGRIIGALPPIALEQWLNDLILK